ncbi:hypothetical protein MY11210_000106 [Beauveria gryllotalpidicola]
METISETQYSNKNRAFLQAMLARSSMTFRESRPVIAAILNAENNGNLVRPEQVTEEMFDNFMRTAREAASLFDYEIRRTQHQVTKERVYAFVNTASDAQTQLATTFSHDELAFIKRALEAMFDKYNTPRMEVIALTDMQAVKLARPNHRESAVDRSEDEPEQSQAITDKGLKHSEVEIVLQNLVGGGWFEKSREGFYSLTPRSLLELRPWLLGTFNYPDAEEGEWQRIKFCEACKDIVTVGVRCADPDCNVRIHVICEEAFWRTRRNKNCPGCSKEWTAKLYVGERATRPCMCLRCATARWKSVAERRMPRGLGEACSHLFELCAKIRTKQNKPVLFAMFFYDSPAPPTMLEYFTYKKVKKHNAQKKAKQEADDAKASADDATTADDIDHGTAELLKGKGRDDGSGEVDAVLHEDDERFIANLLAEHDGPAPPLPPRIDVSDLDWPSDNDTAAGPAAAKKDEAATKDEAKEEAKADKKPNRLSLLFTRHKKAEEGLKPQDAQLATTEAEREKRDLGNVLDRLNLSAKNNKIVPGGGGDSAALLARFTQVFKDLVNGVPTAVDDLTSLIEDRDGTIAKGFDKLPSSLKKLVTQLPDKVTATLGPEILAAAAASQGIKANTDDGLKGTAKKIFLPQNITELVTKPGAVVAMLRAIVEALKTRWPAFIGMNVLWSVALSLLLFVLWYCYKRGREVRLEREKTENVIDGSDRFEELPDDPMLPAPSRAEVTPPEETTAASSSRELTEGEVVAASSKAK